MPRYALTLALVLSLLGSVAFGAPKPKVVGQMNWSANTQTFRYGTTVTNMRNVAGDFHASVRAPQGATAQMDVPSGLGIPSPLPWIVENVQAGGAAGASEVWRYWGCSATVPKGQPEILKGSGAAAGVFVGGSRGYADPMKTTGINEASRIKGDYTLHISYLGDIAITMTDAQEFLDPLIVTAPAEPSTVDATKAIALAWNAVPRAAAYGVFASGKNKAGKSVIWSSTRGMNAWSDLGVAKAVKKGVLLPPDHLACTIPAGIFTGQVSVSITAYSTETWGKGVLPALGWAQSVAVLQIGTP